MIQRTLIIARREFLAYFATPLAAVFLVIFLFLAGLFTFNIGGLYERGQADLRPFFQYHPWLFLFLVPAVSMRLGELVVGKFLAAWGFTLVALALTAPTWITVNWLGEPDNGVILSGYLGSALMAGSFLAVGACISAFSKSQVIAFVSCVVACFLLLLTGFPAVQDFFNGWAPRAVVEALASMSALIHFEALVRGVVDLRDLLFFVSVIVSFLFMNALVIDWKKAL
jgi:ABC-2 type transport system permease protein